VGDLNEKTAELEAVNEKLKEIDRLKSMFIASMSHELRTPLNSVIGYSSIVLNEWLGPVSAPQKEKLAIVLRSGKHLLSLINDVIDVSKIEAGQIEVHSEEFDLFDLVAEAAQQLEPEIRGKGLAFYVDNLHLCLKTDRRRLLQATLNLLSNAMKYTIAGSVRFSAAHPDGMAEIAVSDTGIGISEKDAPHLFQPFVRFDSPIRSTVPGTGLGLYLTRKLTTEILHGDLSFASHVGQGSTFTIRVPADPPDEPGGNF
jgi:signal transduction histidine kinase